VRFGPRGIWLAAALLFDALWMARSLWPALDPGTVQDDARQHVFWMQRLVDPSILRDDLYTDYFASQAPPGYVLLFRALLLVADPLTASKLLPPALGLVAATVTFLLVERLYPGRVAAFLATVLGGWYVWQYDDLATGSPRAFLLPLTVVLLYGLVAGWRWWAVVAVVAAEALVYPSAAALGVLLMASRLVTVSAWAPRVMTDWRAWRAPVASGLVCLALLAPTVFGANQFGPAVDGQTAREMAEFGPNGRNAFFLPDPFAFWVASYRSGFDLRVADAQFPSVPMFFELLALALLLPVAIMVRRRAGSQAFGPAALTIAQILLASLVLFLAAHALLFKLYLPARFVAWTVPLALAMAAGVGMAALLESTATVAGRATRQAVQTALVVAISGVIAAGLALYPAAYSGNFVADRTPEITAYLRELPPNALVVGVPTDADSVPAFSGRRVLVNREYALAYHLGYYRQVERRVRDTIDAYYADSPAPILSLISRYGVTVFLVNQAAYDPARAADAWAGSFEPFTSEVVARAERGRRFALAESTRRCGALTEQEVTVVPAACLLAAR
jgi:hypothetical protein